jgi:PAS domain S-box-containing protein
MNSDPRQEAVRLRDELEELRSRLTEAEDTLRAIRQGDVDALVVGSDIYTLDSSNAATNKLRQDVLAQMEDAVLAFDAGDHLVFMNPAAEQQYRVTASEQLGRPKQALFREVWPDGDVPRESARNQLQKAGAYRGNLVHETPDGVQTHVETTVSVLRDAQGDEAGNLYVIRDITQRVATERSLAAAAAGLARRERQFSTLVENSPDIFSRFDRDLRHVYVSPIIEKITGRNVAEFIGRSNLEMGMPESLCGEWNAALKEVFRTGTVGRVKFGMATLARDQRVFDSRLIPEFDDRGEVESVLSIAVDVTEQEKARLELLESRARLQVTMEALVAADHKKDEFLATLAHELRNPLAPIRNALQIMRLSPAQEVHESARNIIERQLGQMVHLVDDLLDVSRISQGKVELRLARADMIDAVQAAVETSRPWIEAGRHELTVSLPPPETLVVQADMTRLCQIIANLLNNAAKYTPNGGRIEVAAWREDAMAVVRVKDSGVGIPATMLPHVFEMFAQVERHSERAQGGLGIGLALVKQLVVMHGGDVQAHSEGSGQGSEFTVRIPLAEASAPAVLKIETHELEAGAGQGVRVLVVDDNIDSALTMAQMLGILGYQTCTAHDGLEAVRAAQVFAPDVVLLDIGLPHLSGHEAARRIRQLDGGQDLLLVALSGWGQEDDLRKSADAGFDRHFVKPVDLQVLMEVVSAARRG